ncbi:arginine--tRNA ligase [Candidatus Kaiserbacteria bacterium]|nr:arginine--tRNA ligase [Candidatus Kaiserbacteria bacterium]
MQIAARIREQIADALAQLDVHVEPEAVVLEFPGDMAHGDYATSVALAYAKQAGKSPRSLAEEIAAAFGDIDGVAKIEIAGPGFVNFTLAPSAIATTVQAARNPGWAAGDMLAGQEILFEYTSPNLFKPLHIGNLVGNIVGESLARLLENEGGAVRRLNYPSDIGLTVAKGVWGLKKAGADPRDIAALGRAYVEGNAAYENDEAAKKEIEAINKALYEGSDEELSALRTQGIEASRTHLDTICKKLGTTFDTEIFESEASPVGKEIVEKGLVDGVFEKSDGAVVFPESRSGLHTRVFLNSAGLTTYEAKDLGNFELKRRAYPGWQQMFVVTGVEQQEYFKVLIAAIRALFPEEADKRIEHVRTGFLTLTTGKMSSRLGNVLTGESLIADLRESAHERTADSRADDADALADMIAVAALKFEVLKQQNGKNIVFDKERALSLEGDSGPYLQYTHARASAILQKAGGQEVEPTVDAATVPNDVSRLLERFPAVVARAARDLEPHHIAQYLLMLAGAFNSWYAQEQFLDGTPRAAHKVAVTDAVRATLARGLHLLGIPAPDKM